MGRNIQPVVYWGVKGEWPNDLLGDPSGSRLMYPRQQLLGLDQKVRRIIPLDQMPCPGNGGDGAVRDLILHPFQGFVGKDIASFAPNDQSRTIDFPHAFPQPVGFPSGRPRAGEKK